jgi:S1-C subfamily serine protease
LEACGGQVSSTTPSASTTPPVVKASFDDSSGSTANSAMPVTSYADVVSRVAQTVVTIHSQLRVRAPQQVPFMDDTAFQDFFGNRGDAPRPHERSRNNY